MVAVNGKSSETVILSICATTDLLNKPYTEQRERFVRERAAATFLSTKTKHYAVFLVMT